MKLEIKNGRVVDPASGVDAVQTLYCAAGRVVSLGTAPEGWLANRVIDATDLIVAPGLVDLSAHVSSAGMKAGGLLESEVRAAAAGGVTSMVCPPDSEPALDDAGTVEMLRHRAQSLGSTHVYPLGALTLGLKGEQLSEMNALHASGCIAFSQGAHPVVNTEALRRAMQYAATLGYAVWLQPRDPWLGADGVMHEGEMSTRLGLAGTSPMAETLALRTHLALAQQTNCALHVCRITCAESVAIIRQAKASGMQVTCDVSATHLHLIDVDVGFFDTRARLNPPLRTDADRKALRAGVADGTIDAIVSQHVPVPADGKNVPFGEAEPGASALETLLSLTLKWAQEEKIPLARALALITHTSARIAGLPAGKLSPGSAADFCVLDPGAYRVIGPTSFHSASKTSPFLGYELPGVVRYTLVGGRLVYEASAAA
jgi:dihydroorotase